MNDLTLRGASLADHPLATAERLFRRLAGERLDILSSAWVKLDSGRQIPDALVEIRSVAHKIAGTAASLGYPSLGDHAVEVERLCDEGRSPAELHRARRPLMSGLAELVED